jgi:hypothetical protein
MNNAKNYATIQDANYDPQTGQILYGQSAYAHVLGVSDGTCNQLNPLLKTPRYKCGFGAAGGNPNFEKVPRNDLLSFDTTENFENTEETKQTEKIDNGYDITTIINMIIIILIIYLVYDEFIKEEFSKV